MKYFCELQLTNSRVNELVYAQGEKDAEAIARANVAILIEDWKEAIKSVKVTSFYDLGVMACSFDPAITYTSGDYYYQGRKVNNDASFDNGYGHCYEASQKEAAMEDAIMYAAVNGGQGL